MERAQNAFVAEGLKVPWYIARGNHDGLIQGNAPASVDLFRAIATGCLKVFPSAALDPARFAGADESEVFRQIGDPSFLGEPAGRRGARSRRTRTAGTSPRPSTSAVGGAHGYGHVDPAETARPRQRDLLRLPPAQGHRVHLARHRRRGRRPSGNLDNPQYRWLEKTLKAARKAERLVIVYGHHTLGDDE